MADGIVYPKEKNGMESKKVYEKEIALQDLFWKIILDWRRLLAFALIFMILLPIAGYLRAPVSYTHLITDNFIVRK